MALCSQTVKLFDSLTAEIHYFGLPYGMERHALLDSKLGAIHLVKAVKLMLERLCWLNRALLAVSCK